MTMTVISNFIWFESREKYCNNLVRTVFIHSRKVLLIWFSVLLWALHVVLPVCSEGLYFEICVFSTQWNRCMNCLCLSGQWMIYLPPTCLNYDNLSIKVKIMAADTWHFSFHSLPCWDTSLYLITVFHGNLENVCVCLISLYSSFFIQTALLKEQFDQGQNPYELGQASCEFYYRSLFNAVVLKMIHEEEAKSAIKYSFVSLSDTRVTQMFAFTIFMQCVLWNPDL